MAGRSVTKWRVRLAKVWQSEIVYADYHVIEGGVVKFRNQRRNTYPENVIAFAQGAWLSVENLDVEAERISDGYQG